MNDLTFFALAGLGFWLIRPRRQSWPGCAGDYEVCRMQSALNDALFEVGSTDTVPLTGVIDAATEAGARMVLARSLYDLATLPKIANFYATNPVTGATVFEDGVVVIQDPRQFYFWLDKLLAQYGVAPTGNQP